MLVGAGDALDVVVVCAGVVGVADVLDTGTVSASFDEAVSDACLVPDVAARPWVAPSTVVV